MAGAYQTVLVGTDGSDTSFRAVDRAAGLARDAGAHAADRVGLPARTTTAPLAREKDLLGSEAYQLVGSAPAEDNVGRARDRAVKAGAGSVDTLTVQGDPVEVLRQVADGPPGRPDRGRQPRAEPARRPASSARYRPTSPAGPASTC